MKASKFKLSLWLFGINFFISTFTFGGGYVVIPMVRKYFVDKKQLFTETELMEMAAIAQSSPGAIAVNLSVLCGYKISKMKGAIISCMAAILPPLLILYVISTGYQTFRDNPIISTTLKGMEAGVAAIIVDFILDLCYVIVKEQSRSLSLLVPVAFIVNFLFNINVAWIILISIGYCLLTEWLSKGRSHSC